MKIFNLSIFICFALLLSSCTSEVSKLDGQRDNVFTLTASMPAGRPETRLALTETDEGDMSVKWKEGDKISLCFVSGETVRTLSDIAVTNIREDGKKADFSFALPEGITAPFDLYGIYGATLEENGKTVTFPTAPAGSGLPDTEPVCVMRFALENLMPRVPVSVSLTHLGSLLSIQLINSSDAGYTLTGFSLAGNEGYDWLYNASGQAAYDIVTGTFTDAKAGATLNFPLPPDGLSIAPGATTKVYGWIVPTAAPDASKTITATLNGTAMPQALPAKAFAAGNYYRLKLWWDGTNLKHISLPPASDLIAHWKFDGDANNSVENKYHGTVNGAVLTEDKKGNSNRAYSFDGSSHIRINDGAITAFGENSFSCNVWINSIQSSGLGNVLRTDDCWSSQGWLLRFNNGRIEIWEGRSNSYSYISTNQYSDGKWHMLTFVRDVENKKGILYVDGVLIGNYDITGIVNNVSSRLGLWIGSGNCLEYYRGKIDDVRIYNRALTAEEVLALYLSCC
ncbi:LamG-like jellyroll fold domain-containing protein [Phocaeicola abscessus]|uniref:LamG-like jellyroll fold domain-containing protein n=1 Tax=Phocaeicola abscessus TaxID=555313 RepID=UPI0028EDF00D|nr:LamG-like jellyroll fold domain-containing protein [Phocaeicola abscessus]